MGNGFSRIIDRLVFHDRGPRVSILTEADTTGLDLARARIAAKDALDHASAALDAHETHDGVRETLGRLTSRIQDPRFWSTHRAPGLGIFVAPDLEELVDLPSPPEAAGSVGLVFRVLELFEAAQQRDHLVLALSTGRVKLFRISPSGAREVDVSGMPRNLDEVARFADIETSLQHHAGAGGGSAVYHGQEAGVRQVHHLRDRFLRLIDEAIMDVGDLAALPIVLAGVEEITSGFRALSRLPHLVGPELRGNHDRASAADIMTLVGRTVDRDELDPVRLRDRTALTDDTRRVLTDPREVFRAAEEGRIDAVFLPTRRSRHGLVLDEIAAAVHRNGGRVWVESPYEESLAIAALSRY